MDEINSTDGKFSLMIFARSKYVLPQEPNFPIVVDCFSLHAAAVFADLPLQEPKT
ncbi:hypothetical protein Q8A64_08555 [Oxalobacteraceae bacterium R-40]|uniref:Uncharacterized protein n=1 Tax=Keguizhuia sedimenti TaxID=3064264 RepID=A0ABU1BN80_9BURK|nr:hypothetical protein [Oxalobacteraceae bacterium R-40]